MNRIPLEQLEKILAAPFDLEQWQQILQAVFGAAILYEPPREMTLPGKSDLAESALELGRLETQDEQIVGLYWVKVKPQVWLKQNKVGLRSLLRTFYEKQVDGALVVFEQADLWRFSFISEIRVRNAAGEFIDQKTAPKRFTYLLGQDQKVRTAGQRFARLSKPFPLQALYDAFSVESLNEEFYAGVAEHFYELVGKKGGGLLKLPGTPQASHEKMYQDFAVRLIGRIVFCWFLKMKCSEAGVPLLPASFLSSKAVGQGYYHTMLERLFFQILNTPMAQRRKDLPEGAALVPFLNGGLFAPHGEDFYQTDTGLGLSRHLNTLAIPDAWFVCFFEFLEQYHFTLDENSLTQAEVSVDPEMLGRIFESLLAEIDPESGESERKATGSFYTPREIVDFMVQESLMHALHEKTALSLARVRPLFDEFHEEAALDFSPKETSLLLDALFEMKILDPACGSGAFPMGILQKMLVALEKLDPEAKGWIERQIQPLENAALKAQIQEKLDGATLDYARKIGIVQNSIYGVDLQPMATGIAQLRCFLTLIVDEKIDDAQANRSIQPLPNLEFKFVSADALGKLPSQDYVGGLFDATESLEQLEQLKNRYFQSFGAEKEQLQAQITALQHSIYHEQTQLGAGSYDEKSRPYLMSVWEPFSHKKEDWFDPQWMFGVENGFDLVIGNPPYIQMQKNNGALTQRYRPVGYQTLAKTGDIYALFYERSLELLKAGGHSCLITSNKWMRTAYGESLRHFLAKNNPLRLLDLGPGIFTATVDTNILLVQRRDNQNTLQACTLQEKDELPRLVGTPLPALPAPSEAAWIILNPQEQALKEKIEARGTPLKQWPVEIYRGILTGYNTAFIVSTEKRDELIAQDPQSAEILKPILRGRDIQRYSHQWAGLWVIATFPALNLNIDDYPAVKDYLRSFGTRLEQSGAKGSRKKTNNQWFETQDQISYHQAFEAEKVVWQEIVRQPQFFVDTENFYPEATCFSMTEVHMKALCGILNSKPFTFFFRNFYAGGGLGNEGIRYKKKFLQLAPIPLVTPINQTLFNQIEALVDVILEKKALGVSSESEEREIDRLVFGLYGLSEAEIRVVNGEGL